MQKKKLLNVIAAGLFLVALILWFAVPAIATTFGNTTVTYSFLDLAFGRKETIGSGSLSVTTVIFKFSFWNFLVLLFLLVGVLLAVARVVTKLEKNKAIGFVLLVLGILSVLLIGLVKNFTVLGNDGNPVEALKNYKLTGGTITAMILAGLGGVAGVTADLLK